VIFTGKCIPKTGAEDELNPIERLWKVMNEHARNGKYFATTKEFRQKIDDFFAVTLPRIADTLDSWINDNFQTLTPAS